MIIAITVAISFIVVIAMIVAIVVIMIIAITTAILVTEQCGRRATDGAIIMMTNIATIMAIIIMTNMAAVIAIITRANMATVMAIIIMTKYGDYYGDCPCRPRVRTHVHTCTGTSF